MVLSRYLMIALLAAVPQPSRAQGDAQKKRVKPS